MPLLALLWPEIDIDRFGDILPRALDMCHVTQPQTLEGF